RARDEGETTFVLLQQLIVTVQSATAGSLLLSLGVSDGNLDSLTGLERLHFDCSSNLGDRVSVSDRLDSKHLGTKDRTGVDEVKVHLL
ncbi:hypothetical protein PFISCL1PPCAC_16693, partial [Pristionchus fissidentatus]